jgi:hypothetical protein
VFCFIFFSLVFRDRLTGFYAILPVLFGGLTISTFSQYVLSPLYLWPLAMACATLWIGQRRRVWLLWLLFLMCVSANHYLPQYLALAVGTWILALGGCVVLRRRFPGSPLWREDEVEGAAPRERDRSRPVMRTAALLALCLGALGPALFVHGELREGLVPTRGNETLGEAPVRYQPAVNVEPRQYRFLVRIPTIDPGNSEWGNLAYSHSVFYIGWIPLILAGYGLAAARRAGPIATGLTLAVLGVLALGDRGGVWTLLRDYVPLFYLRHPYPLALPITLLIVVLSGIGFERLRLRTTAKVLICLAVAAAGVYAAARVPHGDGRYAEPFELRPFRYPSWRWPYSRHLSEVPLDSEPLITKRASATHPSDDFVLFGSSAYRRLVARDLPLLSGNLFAFAPHPYAGPPAEDARNLFDNGSVERWSVQAAGQGTGLPVPSGALFTWRGLPPDLSPNRDARWVRDGSVSAGIILSAGGSAELAWTHPDASQVAGRFVRLSTCLASPEARRLGVFLKHVEGPRRAETGKRTRAPEEAAARSLAIDAYSGTGEWKCFSRVLHVSRDADAVAFGVEVGPASASSTRVYLDQFELHLLEELRDSRPIDVPVRFVDDRNPNHLVIEARVPATGYLVRRETFHRGWSARVDGIPTPIEEYAGSLQAVPVSPGTHRVEFQFWSRYGSLLWLHVASVVVGYVWLFRDLSDSIRTDRPRHRGDRMERGEGTDGI